MSDYVEEGVPFYRSKEIIQKYKYGISPTSFYITEQKFSEIEKKYGAPAENDILITSVGTLGIPYLVKSGERFYFKDGNLIWFRKQDDLLSKFIYFWMQTEQGKAALLETAIGSSQQAKLEKRFAREIEVIKRDDRLEIIAKDIVFHFPRRGYLGKGLVITLDKFTAVRMYDKVQRLWKAQLKDLRGQIQQSSNDIEKARLKKIVDYMRTVEMAVVISEDAGEEDKFKQQGLDIKPHRDRMNRLDKNTAEVEDNFKNPAHPLQLVFVCAMWLTGFDAPTVSTLYMDKPQKDTLMQTIARANRVISWQINGKSKINGEIIDYYNVFRNMKKALKDYAQGEEGLDEPPVREKAELFRLLEEAIQQGLAFCREKEIALDEVLSSKNVFENLGRLEAFADILLSKDEWRKAFNVYENTISSLYEAYKPEILGRDAVRPVAVFHYLRGIIESKIDQQDISALSLRISELLDESVVVDNAEKFAVLEHSAEYQMVQKGKTWDLSKINFEKLKEDFQQATYKNIEIADLRAFIERRLEQMLQQNITRTDFAQRLQQIIDAYNAGGSSAENSYEDLMDFLKEMQEEDERHVREGLSEDELELFDLLKKDRMTQDETQKVRLAAKSLLHRLLEEAPKVLVQDWYKDSQSQKIVRTAVEQVLDENLPDTYDRILFKEKCDTVFELMLDYASTDRKWAA